MGVNIDIMKYMYKKIGFYVLGGFGPIAPISVPAIYLGVGLDWGSTSFLEITCVE